nr:HAMP domain-containing histidine kinase [Propionibacterium sp.]
MTPPGGAPASVRPLAKGTLSRTLVLRVTSLVALVAIALSGLTLVVLDRILEAQLDAQVLAAAGRVRSNTDERRGGLVPLEELRCGGPERGGPGQQQGLLMACSEFTALNGLVPANGRVQTGTVSQPLTAAQVAGLIALAPTAGPVTVAVEGLGLYRVTVGVDQFDRTVVIGLPATTVTEPLTKAALAAGVLTVAAIALAFAAARTVVRNALRPLQRLANTAHQVSSLELHSGEVAVPVRVPPQDTDPRSEVGQVGLAFNRMLDNVESALAARQRSETKVRQFVADASHELRNPLASIRGYAELTRRERGQTPPDTAHALSRIESESARMSALVEDLLLLARLDAGPSLDRTPTVLNELVANAVSDAQAAGPDHDWELSLPEQDIVAVVDPFRLHQAVTNLLANARTHTPAGTHVLTTLAAEAGDAVIRVADDGPGLPDSVRDRVFERFTRADAARARSGGGSQSTGLGLAIVSAVLQAHHGSATVESSPGGTTFTLRVPLAPR